MRENLDPAFISMKRSGQSAQLEEHHKEKVQEKGTLAATRVVNDTSNQFAHRLHQSRIDDTLRLIVVQSATTRAGAAWTTQDAGRRRGAERSDGSGAAVLGAQLRQ